MKVTTNDGVLNAWRNGLSACNHKETLTSRAQPDGYCDLFSYDLKIGSRTPSGNLVLANYTAPVGGFKSMTTSQHVCLARDTTHENLELMNPLVWESSALSDRMPF